MKEERVKEMQLDIKARSIQLKTLLCLFLTCPVFISCTDEKKFTMPDPETELLFSGNSSAIVCWSEKHKWSDTILIDHKQRIITNKDEFSESLIQYDQRNVPIRVFQNSDVVYNLLTNYEMDKAGIIHAVTHEIDTFGWNYSQKHVRKEAFDIEEYKIDEQGLMLTIESRNNGKTTYLFGKDGRLIESIRAGHFHDEIIKLFFYEKGKLSKLYVIVNGKRKLAKYFSNNTLDSIVFDDDCMRCHSFNGTSPSVIEKR
jgi:hypothetical protein